MSLISIEDALSRLLKDIIPIQSEQLPLLETGGRVLAEDVKATRTQPPFSASAMDGYAVKASDTTNQDNPLKVIGEVAAGHSFEGTLKAGEALRIFTGAPVPGGADAILMQENARRDGDNLFCLESVSVDKFIRPAGLDFHEGQVLLTKGTLLGFRELSLAGAMNHATLPVRKKPVVAILANGDELVEPGQTPGPNQIIASNQVGIAEFVKNCGATPMMLGIAPDQPEAIAARVKQAIHAEADILVTLGGASVGDHDLIQGVLGAQGMELDFWRIAMRPGKPLMAGALGPMKVLGLPGNPVSSLVCALLFLGPLLDEMLARSQSQESQEVTKATLAKDLPANDLRQDYVRASLSTDEQGNLIAEPFSKQDSSMLALLTKADTLIVRPPHAPAAKAGEKVDLLKLR
ncbi:Molybdopterin molybdenumtransferase [Pseudovibrio axinellae]|uniref:Molybdopterin molybdenumtransferase n=1 Tax=Pseudovibrio axinellae TaxID=989403 RepID=A0A166B555_9HYPH|nr:gephyrin-like molybdotransferase Glp [Pseudovibrio axinellae]KZL21899.1 Molybdopterin molybdenumtransferase [Pseudovibrio axinellae]SEQ82952.1 molybdopterin molybdochelatase [Pseudovibrio axinellae]